MNNFFKFKNIKCWSISTHPDDFDHEINSFIEDHRIVDIQTHITPDKKPAAMILYTDENDNHTVDVLQKALYYVKAKFDIDHDVMGPDDVKQLTDTIIELEKIIDNLK